MRTKKATETSATATTPPAATTTTPPTTTTPTTDTEIEAYRRQIKELKEQIAEFEQERVTTTRSDNEEWLREQLDTLAIDVDTSSAPQNHDQWRRCLKGIAGGDDWRHGTWR